MQPDGIILLARKAAVDADDLHGIINLGWFQISDGARNIEDEFEYLRRAAQGLRSGMEFAGEHTVQKVLIEVLFIHLVNLREHGLSSVAVVAALPQR